jgi:hypothetical protein
VRDSEWFEIDFGKYPYVAGGGLANIYDIWAKFKPRPFILSEANSWFDREVSPQLSARSRLLIDSAQYQAERDGRQENSSKGGYQGIVRVSESLSTSCVNEDNAGSLIFIVASLGSCLIAALV